MEDILLPSSDRVASIRTFLKQTIIIVFRGYRNTVSNYLEALEVNQKQVADTASSPKQEDGYVTGRSSLHFCFFLIYFNLKVEHSL